jgi:two-component system, OmpR family, sensor histidine kinase BaeS
MTTAQPLARVGSLKVKLGLLVAVSATAAALVASLGRVGGVPLWLSLPVTVALALAVTQLLAVGMTSPLRQMTAAAGRMATGDYAVRVADTSSDEVGDLARAFNTMARDLSLVDRQRRELVANVSHELRTPLAGLCAVLENLVDGVAPRDPASLETALAQAERMSHLVEDLLDLARVDAGRAPLTPAPVPVATLLESAVAEAGVGGRDVWYAVRVQPEDLVVRADPARLRQLVANLLDNAARHSPAGGSVAVSAVRSGERWLLEVHDQGPGIAPGDRERVFEPFGTLSGDGSSGGTGLGLAIARWVTDLHGGSIAFVEPESGHDGARVRVALPLEPADRPDREPAVARGVAEIVSPESPPPPRAPTAVPAPPVLDGLFGAFWPELGVPARLRVLFGALGVGLLGAIVMPFRDFGLGTFLVLLAAGGVVLGSARRRDAWTFACAGLCVLLSMVVVIRAADWVMVLCLMAGGALCVCAVTGGRTASGLVLSGIAWPLAGLRGLPWLGRTLGRLTGLGHGAALLRTVVWSLLGLLVFGVLLASADALLAQWWSAVLPDLSIGGLVLRAFLTVAVGGTVLAAAYLALNPPRVDIVARAARPVAHRFEWLVPVLVVDAVFLAFLVAQAAAIFGGHGYVERQTGLTYAAYVHQGFGQLTVATALTLLVIWAAARKVPREDPTDRLLMRAALGLLCLQTLVVVASALHRMALYQDAYGFTQLRLLVDVFEGWLGVLVLAVLGAGLGLRAAWLPRFALVSGVVAVLGLAAVNPDAWIARHNLDRYAETGKVDWTYLRTLSDDAVPVLADLSAHDRACALGHRTGADDDWLEWNLGRHRAADVLPPSTTVFTDVAIFCPDS